MRTWYGHCEKCGLHVKLEEQEGNLTAPSSYRCRCGNGLFLTHWTQYELPTVTKPTEEELSRPMTLPFYSVRTTNKPDMDELRRRYGPPPTGE